MSKCFVNDDGFTLIEVMVALAVFAVSASMLMLSGGNSIRQAGYIREKVLSVQVADQYLNKVAVAQYWPEKGVRGAVQKYAGYNWYLRETVLDDKLDGFRKIIVEVFLGDMPPDEEDVARAALTSHLRMIKK